MNRPIGIFDSGIGGLTVLDECRRLLPREDFVYLSDCRNAPYGSRDETFIRGRVFACADILLGEGAKAVVVACNTATNVGIGDLRKRYSCAFVGVEPAVKPAAEALCRGYAAVLVTEATARQQKFMRLIESCGAQKCRVLPQKDLAMLVERNIENLERIRPDVERIFEERENLESVVLGCTHYVFLKDMIRDILGAGVEIYDGGAGTARRLKAILEKEGQLEEGRGEVRFITT